MTTESILKIIAYGAWNGGTLVDNSVFENKGMTFKNNIPVTSKAIEERIGVRTRIAAPEDVRIGSIAMQDLLDTSGIDPARIKLLIGATNVGEDKYDPGPVIRFPLALIEKQNPDVVAMDLYAGCPGFNVAVELVFMLSLCGILKPGDISVVVGAENIHRAKAFKPQDTASIIFGDDALATALETTGNPASGGGHATSETLRVTLDPGDFTGDMARAILRLTGGERIDGLILDNQLGGMQYRVPATAARVQHRLVELMHPEAAEKGVFRRFRDALKFYDTQVDAFAFDIMSMGASTDQVEKIAGAYVRSGKYQTVVSVFLGTDMQATVTVHRGSGFTFTPPKTGIIDTATRTHGCFDDFIQAVVTGDDVFGEMDGKGVFLYATRGATKLLTGLLAPHGLTLDDIDLLIEHQANFAMIPLTLEQVLADRGPDVKKAVTDYIAHRMLTNVHTRGNCSVVCMQRLPYDLHRGVLAPDTIQGFPINRNLEKLRSAGTILNDSVGAGMTRSAFLQKIG